MHWFFRTAFWAGLATAFNNPPGVEIWCGKAYQSTNASFAPGGWLDRPTLSSRPLLDIQVRPRMSLYASGDGAGSFIVDAEISHLRGEQWDDDEVSQDLQVEISIDETQLHLKRTVTVDSSSTEVDFPLRGIPARFEPYSVTVKASRPDGRKVYTAKTQLYHLPRRRDGGSISKLDSLYGGLLVQNQTAGSTSTWSPLLPYSFYVSWDGWLEKSLSNVQKFKDDGYNIIHIVPNAGLANQAFNFTVLNRFLDKCDEVGLWVMYDMRWTYKNHTSVRYQVDMLKTHKSLLLWYTGDEPDGNSDPVHAPKATYELIKSLDPWHPVSLCLNCYNFHYAEYSSGADIILSDVYPIGINATYSTVWNTPCNTTYGDCGCDDCKGELEDIAVRLDRFAEYQTWLGRNPKTFWGVPMAFGNESYWPRYPTPDEEITMTMLSLNHNAKGIVMWDYPTSDALAKATSQLSRVVASDEVARFMLGASTVPLSVTGGPSMDAAGWRVGDNMLVSILSLQYSAWSSSVTVELPEGARAITRVLWGSGHWRLVNGHLAKNGGDGLETDLVVVQF